jgi:hypothetical protein
MAPRSPSIWRPWVAFHPCNQAMAWRYSRTGADFWLVLQLRAA